MEIVDKKMRLFGKIPLIFIFIALGLILSILIILQILNQKPHYVTVRVKGSPGNWWWVTPRPPDWLVYSIKPGDKEYNALGKATAEVLEVNIYDAGGPTKDIYAKIKLQATLNKRTGKYRYKGEPLEIGGPLALNLSNALFPGMVVEILEEGKVSKKEFVEKIVFVRYKDRWPWEFDAIKIGDVMTDGAGKVMAEIIGKERKPAEREIATDKGEVLRRFSPVLDDFFIKLKLKIEIRNGELVFREEQYLKVGNAVWILFPNYNFSGAQIMSIE